MLEQKIVYKDPIESEVLAIIDLSDKPQSNLKSGNYIGRNMQVIDKNQPNDTAKKISNFSGACNFCKV